MTIIETTPTSAVHQATSSSASVSEEGEVVEAVEVEPAPVEVEVEVEVEEGGRKRSRSVSSVSVTADDAPKRDRKEKDRKKKDKHRKHKQAKRGDSRSRSRSREKSRERSRGEREGGRERERDRRRSEDSGRLDGGRPFPPRDQRDLRDLDLQRGCDSRRRDDAGRDWERERERDDGFSRRRHDRQDYNYGRRDYNQPDQHRRGPPPPGPLPPSRNNANPALHGKYHPYPAPPPRSSAIPSNNTPIPNTTRPLDQHHNNNVNASTVPVRTTVSDSILVPKPSDNLNADLNGASVATPSSGSNVGQQQQVESSAAVALSSLNDVEITFGDDEEEKLIEERRKRRQAILDKYNADKKAAEEATAASNAGVSVLSVDSSASFVVPAPVVVVSVSVDSPVASGLQSHTSVEPDVPLVLEQTITHTTKPSPEKDVTAPEAEISAADYDPNQDGAYDEEHRHHKRVPSAGNQREMIAKVMDDNDMFNQKGVVAPSTDTPATTTTKKPKKKKRAVDEFDMFADVDMFAADTDAAGVTALARGPTHILESAVVVRSSDNPNLTDNWDDPEGYYRIILGEVLDNRYHVYQILGRGVFSSVVKARDTKNGDVDVAIKVIRNNDTMYRAGMKEIGILKKLIELDPDDKKHVIRLIRHFEHKNHLCMVFESLSMNLREVLKKFGKDIGLNIKAVRVYAQQLFLSLSLLKKANILHADIKPDNILVTESKNTLKLCDLGSASDASENEITPYLVSRFYRAPEIIIGLSYDFAMDMWSIACTLYELYTGKILFPGRSNNQMLHLFQQTKGPFPKKLLRKGQFTSMHFDESFNFLQVETDKISGKDIIRPCAVLKATKDMKTRLMDGFTGGEEEKKMVENFVDLLEKCLVLAPDKRLTVQEALVHPFVRNAVV
ncbi:UNVERIFIED_CONTAM: U4/U6 small nuclear ribonucleoprotein prp4 [Siphonaria sp. JEL0065]|nr:U4/U6 small nuclear ribonucleoprotein prp4 [Siphonaria sp. JEL0065]